MWTRRASTKKKSTAQSRYRPARSSSGRPLVSYLLAFIRGNGWFVWLKLSQALSTTARGRFEHFLLSSANKCFDSFLSGVNATVLYSVADRITKQRVRRPHVHNLQGPLPPGASLTVPLVSNLKDPLEVYESSSHVRNRAFKRSSAISSAAASLSSKMDVKVGFQTAYRQGGGRRTFLGLLPTSAVFFAHGNCPLPDF